MEEFLWKPKVDVAFKEIMNDDAEINTAVAAKGMVGAFPVLPGKDVYRPDCTWTKL